MAREPLIALAAAGLPAGAWCATAGAAALKNVRCDAGTCTGTFAGTHPWLVYGDGKFAGADKVVDARTTGDLAVLKYRTLTWAYAPVTPAHATPLTGASPITTSVRIARLKP
ncbi:hypothetical protein GCM10010260_19810 [Streptomyces filipinensis]|uniref:Uncharacterized protein n=1 Tax=Streptomyces filipinensis TaxID=66887 RepID=A0A918I8A9_9ACTN|nr:hypothetical protein [Streptomyces filipinensis]GGU86693.1 hypothetical protein GCM10010260_19810 [Streptomyces filipinensis]